MLPEIVELAIGVQVMVTRNLDTDLDITNGAWGVVVDILHSPSTKPYLDQKGDLHLQSPPVFILVKLDWTRVSKLPGLDSNMIPIQSVS